MPSKNSQLDYSLLFVVCLLIVWGISTLAMVSFPFSLQEHGNSSYYILHQLLFGLLPGGIAAFIIFKLNLEKFKKISPFLLGINIILILLIFIPQLGVKLGGATRWLKLGPIVFQPSELLKITFLFYLASWLSTRLPEKKPSESKKKKKKSKKKDWQASIVFIVFLTIITLTLISQPNFSTFVLIFIIGIAVYFVSRVPWWHAISILAGGAGVGFLLIRSSAYRWERVVSFLTSGGANPLGAGYQLKQALISIGSGKVFGIGEGLMWGLSRQKFGFLPKAMSDAVFATIGEELGFIGAVALIVLFILFAWKGIKNSLRAKNSFYKFLGIGVVTWITTQAFFNIGGITGILPLAGIPLPFFSYGSSHFIIEMIGIGILLNVSRQSTAEKHRSKHKSTRKK